MSVKIFRLPADVGAANVQVFGPDGEPVSIPVLATAGDAIPFDVRQPGVFHVRVDPIGEDTRLLSFEIDDLSPEELSDGLALRSVGTGPALGSLEVLPEVPQRLPSFSGKAARALHDRDAVASTDEILTVSRRLRTISTVEIKPLIFSPVDRHVTVGLSYDAAPLAPGGWKPFHGPWDASVVPDGPDTALEIRRDPGSHRLTEENARLRVHVAVEKQKAMRLLVPMFMGGVRVTVRVTDADVGVVVRPLDPTLHVLMQAFDAGSEADPLVLLDRVARTGSDALDSDPWAETVFGVLARRKHPDAYPVEHAVDAAKRFPWMADVSILAGNLLLTRARPDIDLALRHLSHARRIGAPYFKVTNALLGDLLVTLAADAPDAFQRRRAATELALWRRRIPFQFAAGPYFAWLMRGGARSGRSLDARYHRTMFRGVFTMPATDTPFDLGDGWRFSVDDAGLDFLSAPDPALDGDVEQ